MLNKFSLCECVRREKEEHDQEANLKQGGRRKESSAAGRDAVDVQGDEVEGERPLETMERRGRDEDEESCAGEHGVRKRRWPSGSL